LFVHFGHIIGFQIKEATKFLKNSKKVSIRYAIPECALKAACFFEKKFIRGMYFAFKKLIQLLKNIQHQMTQLLKSLKNYKTIIILIIFVSLTRGFLYSSTMVTFEIFLKKNTERKIFQIKKLPRIFFQIVVY